jgi:hypothetical protein
MFAFCNLRLQTANTVHAAIIAVAAKPAVPMQPKRTVMTQTKCTGQMERDTRHAVGPDPASSGYGA